MVIPLAGSATAHMTKDGQNSASGDIEIVPGTTLDAAIPEGYIYVLKIDAEGAEPYVIQGFENMFARKELTWCNLNTQ